MSQQWQLAVQFLKNDMDRIDNADYFMKNFQCHEIIKYLAQVRNMKQVNERRDAINLFYDRFISLSPTQKTLYVQMKWIIIIHQVIQNFKQGTPLFGYTLKALQVCIQGFIKFQRKLGPYEKYLSIWLVKPYLQYLCKLCLLNMPQETVKYDQHSVRELETKAEEESPPQNCTKDPEIQSLNLKLIDWYRKYNFIVSTLDTFEKILCEVQRYFSLTFPFLNNIGILMVKDLNIWIFKLKYSYRSLKNSGVTVMELDEIQTKIKLFSKSHFDYFEHCMSNPDQRLNDCGREDLKDFLQSPLKPIQIKLFNRKSLDTPLSAFLKQ